MINFMVSGIIAIVAFILSFLIGLISGAAMPLLLVKAVVFAFVFFVIACFAKMAIDRFLPELQQGANPDSFPGSRIDIMEGDPASLTPDYSSLTPQTMNMNAARPDESDEGLGDISSLADIRTQTNTDNNALFSGMDQNAKEDYTENAGSGELFRMELPQKPGGAWKEPDGELSGVNDMLPDLDSMAGAFAGTASEEEPDNTPYPVSTKKQSKKTPGWTEDFNAKEIAKGIQTVLTKDKEG
jgi:hypothetical protein